MATGQRDHFTINDVRDFALRVLIAGGYPEDYAGATAYALLEADKKGVYSHGVAGGTGLEEAVKRSGVTATVDPIARYEINETRYPTILIINAHGAPGHITSYIATDLVKERARKLGIAKVFVNNANHFGAAGVWSERIAEDRDLEGVVTCTTAATVRPMGDDIEGLDYTKGAGSKVRTGTNPEAISIPHSSGIVTFDAAYTRLAASYCIKALKAGERVTIPGYIADEAYQATFDPQDVFGVGSDGKLITRGSFFPLGSAGAGYKGDNKLRMIEMDNAFGGGPVVCIDSGSAGPDRRISHTFYAQAVDFLYGRDEALARIRALMRDYEENYFGESSRWPGDRANEALNYATSNGIPYSDGQIDTLRRAAEHVGLGFDLRPISRKDFPAELFRK